MNTIPIGPSDTAVKTVMSEELKRQDRLAEWRESLGKALPWMTDESDSRGKVTDYELAVLHGLQRQPHIYSGTVPYGVIVERRRKAKAARAARRINRKASR